MASPAAPQSSIARNFKNDLIDFTLKSKMKEPVFLSRDVGKGRAPEFISIVTIDGLKFVTPHTFLQRKAADQEVCRIALEHFTSKQKKVLSCCQGNMPSLQERLLKIQKETKGHAKPSKTIIKGGAGGFSQVVEKVESVTHVPEKRLEKRSVEDDFGPVSKRLRAIINDMGPASIKKSLVEDTMAVMQVLEMATTLNAREFCYLEEAERLRKMVMELKGEIAKMENDYSNYKEKYVVQESFIIELGQKEKEINNLKGSNESLTMELYMLKEQNIALENDLRLANQKLSALVEENEKLENVLLTSAQESFDNAIEQVKCLNPEVELKTAGMCVIKSVEDGHLKAPEGYVEEEEAKDV